MTQGKVVQSEKLRNFCQKALMSTGIPDSDAAIITDTLIEADLRGIETHGVQLLPGRIQNLRDGDINPHPNIKILRETSCTAVLDGDTGPGNLVAVRAMEIAIAKAAKSSVGIVGVRRGEHAGALFYYPSMAVKQGMIGFMTANGFPFVPPYGGKTGRLNTSPWSFAIPAGKELPIVLDMAVTNVANLKIIMASKKGIKIPLDWALDEDGVPTDDPLKGVTGFPQWMGGAKGYGLAVISEVLAGILTGGQLKRWAPAIKGKTGTYIRRGHFMLALNIESFMPLKEFTAEVDVLIKNLKESERIKGVKEILLPGERGLRTREERLKSGIPIGPVVWGELENLGKALNISSVLE